MLAAAIVLDILEREFSLSSCPMAFAGAAGSIFSPVAVLPPANRFAATVAGDDSAGDHCGELYLLTKSRAQDALKDRRLLSVILPA